MTITEANDKLVGCIMYIFINYLDVSASDNSAGYRCVRPIEPATKVFNTPLTLNEAQYLFHLQIKKCVSGQSDDLVVFAKRASPLPLLLFFLLYFLF